MTIRQDSAAQRTHWRKDINFVTLGKLFLFYFYLFVVNEGVRQQAGKHNDCVGVYMCAWMLVCIVTVVFWIGMLVSACYSGHSCGAERTTFRCSSSPSTLLETRPPQHTSDKLIREFMGIFISTFPLSAGALGSHLGVPLHPVCLLIRTQTLNLVHRPDPSLHSWFLNFYDF